MMYNNKVMCGVKRMRILCLHSCPHDRSRDEVVSALICSLIHFDFLWHLFKLKPKPETAEIWNLQRCCFINCLSRKCIHPHCSSCRPTWPNSSLSMNQGRNKFSLSFSTPTLPPPIPLKPPDTERGCLVAPTQTPGVLRVGCLHSFFIHCYHGRVWFGSPPDWNQRNGDWSWPLPMFIVLGWRGEGPEPARTHQSVSSGLPLIVWMDRLTGDPEALNCRVCVPLSMHVCLCSRRMRKHFITTDWNVTLQAHTVCFICDIKDIRENWTCCWTGNTRKLWLTSLHTYLSAVLFDHISSQQLLQTSSFHEKLWCPKMWSSFIGTKTFFDNTL